MAELFECPVCEKLISTSAKTCPSCGQTNPIEEYKKTLGGRVFDATVTHTTYYGVVYLDLGHKGIQSAITIKNNRLVRNDRIKVRVIENLSYFALELA